MPRAVLLDVEGTTTPISFVYDVLFPYARTHMGMFLRAHVGDAEVQTQLHQLRKAHEADRQNGAVPPSWDESEEIDSAEQVAELDAALDAGYDTCLCVRPGNRPQPHTDKHPLIRGFDDLV